MKIDFLKTIDLDEAIAMVQYETDNQKDQKTIFHEVALEDALGMTVYEEVIAPSNLPAFNRSTVDGYALRSKDTNGASESIPAILSIMGEVTMGNPVTMKINECTAIYVPTGGMLPDGADGMVMIEDTEKIDEATVLIYRPARIGDYISYIGDDVKEGDCLIEAGKKITAYDIALLAGMGFANIKVVKKPVFTVLSTGDEIVDLHESCDVGQVRDINGYGVSAWIREKGGSIYRQEIIKDEVQALKEALKEALELSDAVILSGGSSMGYRDYTKEIIESFDDGKVLIHGLAIKPGKPSIVGKIKGKMVFGLPGHPVSALMVCQHIVGAFMDHWFGRKRKKLMVQAISHENIHGAAGRDMYQMVKLKEQDGEMLAIPIYGKSGLITTLAHASGWFKIGKTVEGVVAGDRVDVELLQEVRF
ncbi:molybdopterin molybdotransferase MoeA [Marinisporobacter balticus]|uniref:Molybdopterin molybdenumtransferase n=1 Tax=Marinisporobacter balticus TaxID=2018667 RepID=A0A4R2KU55_9FIRM|nr:gephyrin-like molybdotransferase Glp [Marinisporobacter balticus]TCO77404.1 molybdopterin molybdochelatase [Marinisporobacter balticus]